MKSFFNILLGSFIGLLIGYSIYKSIPKKEKISSEESVLIREKIKNVSKLISAEGEYADIYTYKDKVYYGSDVISFKKEVILFTKAKAQVSYNLKEMEIELDSIDKKIIIKKVPEPTLQIFPDISFYNLEQSTFNKFDKDQLNTIKTNAEKYITEKVHESDIEQRAKENLLQNLNDLFLLSKFYGWEIQNQTAIELL